MRVVCYLQMELEKIRELWEEDSQIDSTDLPGELYKISRLHSKYFNILNSEKQIFKRREIDYNKLKKIKREYYLGRFSRKLLEELGWDPVDQEIKASDIPDYLKGDSDLCDLEAKMYVQEVKVDFLKDIIKAIHTRGINLRTAMEMLKFQNGEL